MTDEPAPEEPDVIRISNEFAYVEVSKVRTPRGERLEIREPRSGHRIRIDALGLESLSWQDSDIFSEFLKEPETPFGPDGDED